MSDTIKEKQKPQLAPGTEFLIDQGDLAGQNYKQILHGGKHI